MQTYATGDNQLQDVACRLIKRGGFKSAFEKAGTSETARRTAIRNHLGDFRVENTDLERLSRAFQARWSLPPSDSGASSGSRLRELQLRPFVIGVPEWNPTDKKVEKPTGVGMTTSEPGPAASFSFKLSDQMATQKVLNWCVKHNVTYDACYSFGVSADCSKWTINKIPDGMWQQLRGMLMELNAVDLVMTFEDCRLVAADYRKLEERVVAMQYEETQKVLNDYVNGKVESFQDQFLNRTDGRMVSKQRNLQQVPKGTSGINLQLGTPVGPDGTTYQEIVDQALKDKVYQHKLADRLRRTDKAYGITVHAAQGRSWKEAEQDDYKHAMTYLFETMAQFDARNRSPTGRISKSEPELQFFGARQTGKTAAQRESLSDWLDAYQSEDRVKRRKQTIDGIIIKYFPGNSAKFSQPTESESNMSITITNQVLINGNNAERYADSDLYEIIRKEEVKIEELNKIKNKPQRLVDEIAERQGGIDSLVTFMNSRPAKATTAPATGLAAAAAAAKAPNAETVAAMQEARSMNVKPQSAG